MFFVSNLQSYSQAGRRGFEPCLPLRTAFWEAALQPHPTEPPSRGVLGGLVLTLCPVRALTPRPAITVQVGACVIQKADQGGRLAQRAPRGRPPHILFVCPI